MLTRSRSSGGIGASLATKLSLSHGVNVVLADISLEGISKTSESIKAQNAAAEVLCVETDVSSVAAMRELERQARDKYGKIDLLFLNAGIGMPTKDYGEDFDAWHKTFGASSSILHMSEHGADLSPQLSTSMARHYSPRSAFLRNR